MNEMSRVQHPPAVLPAGLMSMMAQPPHAVATDLQPHELGFRCLRGHEIERIRHLRNQIPLPTAAVSDAGFAMREKKETKSVWSARSCATVSTSARSATFP